MSRIVFMVPAYNESESLPGTIADLREHYPKTDIIVINDGSTDGTAEAALGLEVTLLDLPFNLGIGGAVQTGLLYAARHGYDIAVQFDGDGQHRADEVSKLLRAIQSGQCDAVIGSRFLVPSQYRPPLMRRIGIAAFNTVNSLILSRRISDSTSGFRAYNRKTIEFLAQNYPHDYPEPESVMILCRSGFRILEVQVEMRERQNGQSSITFLRSIYYMCKVMLAILIGATRRPLRRPMDEI
ncbi:MAG: glycosyltransferase family 2 protein [Acidobacteria bacterium]|nr:glycosyltransferase family 2 protein [Acidobacteriota bacterium]